MVDPTVASSTLPIPLVLLGFLVTILASSTFTLLLKQWFDRKRQPSEIHRIEQETQHATADSAKSLAETLQTVCSQLREANEAIDNYCKRETAKDVEIELLNREVERARRAGFLHRSEKRGKGPNPAA